MKPRGPKPKGFQPGSLKGGRRRTRKGWIVDKRTGERIVKKGKRQKQQRKGPDTPDKV